MKYRLFLAKRLLETFFFAKLNNCFIFAKKQADMARDKFHENVREALTKEGWNITDDPLTFKIGKIQVQIDLGAELILGAERGMDKIAVEIKTFIGKSTMYDLHLAVGQFMVYQIALEEKEPDRILFLAVPMEILQEIFLKPKATRLTEKLNLKIIGFDVEDEVIVQWKM